MVIKAVFADNLRKFKIMWLKSKLFIQWFFVMLLLFVGLWLGSMAEGATTGSYNTGNQFPAPAIGGPNNFNQPVANQQMGAANQGYPYSTKQLAQQRVQTGSNLIASKIAWQRDLRTAISQAASSRRLILLHFTAPWCGPCREMEQTTMTDPNLNRMIQMNFIPVKINLDHNPTLARQYGVTGIPAQMILAPNGQLVGRWQGKATATDYCNRLNQVIMAYNRQPRMANQQPRMAYNQGNNSPTTLRQNNPIAPTHRNIGVNGPNSYPGRQAQFQPNPSTQPAATTPAWRPSPPSTNPISNNGPIANPPATNGPMIGPAIGQPMPPSGPTAMRHPQPTANNYRQPNIPQATSAGQIPPAAQFGNQPIVPQTTNRFESTQQQAPPTNRAPSSYNPQPPTFATTPFGNVSPQTTAKVNQSSMPTTPAQTRTNRSPIQSPLSQRQIPSQSAHQPAVGATGTNPIQPNPSFANTANPNRQPPANIGPSLSRSPLANQNKPSVKQKSKPSAPTSLPIGMEGYCPVTLVEKSTWQVGDRRWGATFEGHTYLFASEENQKKFLANPVRFSPISSGFDPVIKLDQGKDVPGLRKHGVYFQNRILLFSSETSLSSFSKNPSRYLQSLGAQRVGYPSNSLK
jgi:YHS domain-containing protein/thiol-disulfide isomerase/thioredoxin